MRCISKTKISKVNPAKAFKLVAIKADMLATAKLKGAHVEAVIREVLAEVEGADEPILNS